ncbi:MAG: RNA-binding protein [Maritimibacter sp.]
MTRGGRPKTQDAAERRCIATGEAEPRNGLIRFAVSPDGVVVADLLEKLPGRGMWVSATPDAFAMARKKGAFARAAKQQVTVPDDLLETVEQGLADRVVDLISLARKAGKAIAGFEKVKGWLMSDSARVLIQSSDGSTRGKTKLRPPDEPNGFIGCLTANELGLAFGRENVIHCALSGGGLTERIVEEALKLSGLREIDGGNARREGTKTR